MDTKITGKLILELLGFRLDKRSKQGIMRNNIAAGAAMGVASLFPGTIGLVRSILSPQNYVIPAEAFFVYLMVLISSLLMAFHGWLLMKNRIRDTRKAVAVMLLYIFSLMCLGITSSLRRLDSSVPILPFILSAVVIFNMFALIPLFSMPLTLFGVWFIFHEMGRKGMLVVRPLSIFLVWLAIFSVSVYRYISVYFSIRQKEIITAQNKELKRLSQGDALTGLKNRYGLRESFDDYLDQYIGVIMMDVDHFKEYNDTYGHETGDAVLKEFASIIMRHFGSGNSYRYGGDEMLVVAPMNAEDFHNEVKAVEKEIRAIHVPGLDRAPTGSIGYVTGKADNDEELRAMIRQADYHLYQAKEQGRSRMVGMTFDPSMDVETPDLFEEMQAGNAQ